MCLLWINPGRELHPTQPLAHFPPVENVFSLNFFSPRKKLIVSAKSYLFHHFLGIRRFCSLQFSSLLVLLPKCDMQNWTENSHSGLRSHRAEREAFYWWFDHRLLKCCQTTFVLFTLDCFSIHFDTHISFPDTVLDIDIYSLLYLFIWVFLSRVLHWISELFLHALLL